MAAPILVIYLFPLFIFQQLGMKVFTFAPNVRGRFSKLVMLVEIPHLKT